MLNKYGTMIHNLYILKDVVIKYITKVDSMQICQFKLTARSVFPPGGGGGYSRIMPKRGSASSEWVT